MTTVEKKLMEMGIDHVQRRVEEGGIYADQLFFHDPDGFMIEICNCDNLPVIPLGVEEPVGLCKRAGLIKQQQQQQQNQQQNQQSMKVQCHAAAIHVKEGSHISCA